MVWVQFQVQFKFLGRKKRLKHPETIDCIEAKKVSIGVDIISHQMSPEIGPRLVIELLRSHCTCPSFFLGVYDLISMNLETYRFHISQIIQDIQALPTCEKNKLGMNLSRIVSGSPSHHLSCHILDLGLEHIHLP